MPRNTPINLSSYADLTHRFSAVHDCSRTADLAHVIQLPNCRVDPVSTGDLEGHIGLQVAFQVVVHNSQQTRVFMQSVGVC